MTAKSRGYRRSHAVTLLTLDGSVPGTFLWKVFFTNHLTSDYSNFAHHPSRAVSPGFSGNEAAEKLLGTVCVL